ncbi:fhkC [Symbiodinium sp. KB8]|nr:fhkC [Symbiodinium sp. KB8]
MGIEVDTAGCNETPLRLSTDCTVLQEKGRYSACAPQIALEKVVAGEPTAFFPYVCVALHHYSDLKGRKSIEESILARCGIHVPMITESPKQEGDEGFMEEFSCAVSGELAYAPCCLSNGKIVVQEATRDARVGCISSALGAEYDVQILASKLGQAGSHSQQRRHPGSCRVNISSLEVMTDKPDDGLKLAGQRCAVQARMRNVYSKEADVWQAAVDVAVPQVEDEALTSSRVWQVKGERLRVKSTLQE